MNGISALRVRLGVGLTALVVLSSAATAVAVGVAADRHADRVRRARVETHADRAVRALRLDVESTLAAPRRAVVERRSPGPVDVLERYRGGLVVGSSAWPERVDTPASAPEPEGRPSRAGDGFVASIPTAAGPRAAWVERIDDPGEDAVVVVGAWLDGGRFAEVARVGARFERGPAGEDPLRVGLPVERGGPAWTLVAAGPEPVAGVPFAPSLAMGVAVLAGVVGALVSRWLVRKATRPLDAVTGAFAAVAEGRADYDFPPSRDAAFGEVVASYSRMRRSLDRERERLRAAERVAAWKETARRVAHEVKNPLAPIRLTIENLVKARHRAPDRFDAMFDAGTRAILEEVARLQRVVDEFSAYARLPAPRRRPEDLDAIVDAIVALYASDAKVVIRRERSDPIRPLRLDRDLLGQAIRNVVDNAAREARGSGGDVVVRTGRDGDDAFVEVRDHGRGFDPGSLAAAFEPYATSREGGTGLGLAIAQRIAVDHGGAWSATNAEDGGGGAIVTLRLPMSPEGSG